MPASNNEIYVIYSPGRTGSHIILEVLAGPPELPGGLCNTIPYWNELPGNFDVSTHRVIHTHSLDVIDYLKLAPKNITLILSQRRDIFAQIMSSLVARITNEWSGKEYSNKTVTAKSIPIRQFVSMFNSVKLWPGDITKYGPFKQIVTIYYEDIVGSNKAQHIAETLGIEYVESSVGTVYQKSPYSYKDCILNWEELYQEFLSRFDNTNK